MSLTSTSVLINLPGALFLIIVLRYFTLDYENRRKAASYSKNQASDNAFSQKKPFLEPKFLSGKSDWRRKVNSPVVEDAIDQFTKHIVSEWVTNLWYSKITPDKQGPDELVLIINGVLGEFSSRMRNINLIDLLTRDIIRLFCTHLELFRACQMKIMKQQSLTIAQRDSELKAVLYAENKLHPALFSAGAEYKVLQHLMDGFISFTFRPEDLQCSLFRYIVREILACAVIRPVVNLANPRFINERIENVVISASKNNKGANTEQVNSSQSKSNGSPKMSTQLSMSIDPSVKGVELAQLKKENSDSSLDNVTTTLQSKDPLLSMDTRKHLSGGEWGDKLDVISRRKTEALAPENIENMWAKGRNYKTKENMNPFTEPPVPQNSYATSANPAHHSKPLTSHNQTYGPTKVDHNKSHPPLITSDEEDEDEDEEECRNNDFSSEDEDNSDITGINSPGTKVWDGKSNRNQSVTHIHHPLESFEGQKTKKRGKHVSTGRKRSRVSSQTDVWQEIERKSFLLEDGHDVLGPIKGNSKSGDSSGDSEGGESLGRTNSGTSTSYIFPSNSSINVQKVSSLDNSFFRLRCEVLGANIVKSGSTTFAVYPISVTDVNNVSWSIKRRFRHFEELHRRLKEYPEYNLHLPPKHFLSTGLDVDVIQERCKLLDIYLKRLMQFPTISGCIEVWDFLSVDSQTYSFSNSISIIETLSVNSATTVREKSTDVDDGDEFPSEWVPPNLSIPILDLVDVVFQLQDGGWVRRKAFWVAKQVLQLGMSDAFDDWLIAKIQLLRRGSIVASGIKRLEQILWPDGIFITKHPKRQQPTPSPRVAHDSPNGQPSTGDEKILTREELQEQEDQRRSKLVYELMIDKAPAAVVSLFGRKQYDQCAKDVYYFIQSSVCLKQFSLDLLELLLLSAFPEMDFVFQQLHDEKQKFGVLEQ
ncbi:hypothetical protein L1987_87305 [Smallanthus sonchifolius]|nr:hypothetical protein L1987_87305 [Smallanthus sonchifolius]